MLRPTAHIAPAVSQNLDPALAQDIYTFFELGTPGESTHIPSGRMHHNFFVDEASSGATHVVRILGYVNTDILGNEARIQDQLQGANVPAASLVRSRSGDYLFQNKDTAATVSAKLRGTHPQPASNAACFVVGKTLGQFHGVVRDLPFQNERTLLSKGGVIFRVNGLQDGSPKTRLTQILERTLPIFDQALPEGVTHGDLHAQNVLIEDGAAAVLDTESAATTKYILDIGRSIADLCQTADKLDPNKIRNFVRGYQSERKLYKAEIGALDTAIRFGCVAVSSWLYKNGYPNGGDWYLDLGTSTSDYGAGLK